MTAKPHKRSLRRLATKWTALAVLLTGLAAFALLWVVTFHPRDPQAEPIFGPENAPVLRPGQTLKVMSYNVQFMAGKGYVFFFDLPNDSGPDSRPSPADIARTLDEVARVITDEAPDIVLLQEVDDGAQRTDHADQLALLLARLPAEYCCHSSTFYWKARYVPHRRIMGSVGMKLSTISKYRISASIRHALAPVPRNPVVAQLHPKRAILETRLPVEGGKDFVVFNLHFEAFPHDSNVMPKQVAKLDALLTTASKAGHQWVAGGDFNLLPPGRRSSLPADQQTAYSPEPEMAALHADYQVLPTLENVQSPEAPAWFTHFPNDENIAAPDRTLDYLVFGPDTRVQSAHVRAHDATTISDHLPIVATFEVH
jgi:endonuclease/exonuclease/phosphatase family metal-dependent hydrolase